MAQIDLLSPISFTAMLWNYKLNFTGIIDAPSDYAQAYQKLVEKIAKDPAGIISSLTPAEPSCKTVGELVKKVFTGG